MAKIEILSHTFLLDPVRYSPYFLLELLAYLNFFSQTKNNCIPKFILTFFLYKSRLFSQGCKSICYLDIHHLILSTLPTSPYLDPLHLTSRFLLHKATHTNVSIFSYWSYQWLENATFSITLIFLRT